jgi:hypothetical protein
MVSVAGMMTIVIPVPIVAVPVAPIVSTIMASHMMAIVAVPDLLHVGSGFDRCDLRHG